MMSAYLEYAKLILSKVAFDQYLFWKEYSKSQKYLSGVEQEELKTWVTGRGFEANCMKNPFVNVRLDKVVTIGPALVYSNVKNTYSMPGNSGKNKHLPVEEVTLNTDLFCFEPNGCQLLSSQKKAEQRKRGYKISLCLN